VKKTTEPKQDSMQLPAKAAAQGRRRRKDARPSEIIDAALEVFAEHGFGAARVEEVARRAGVSKGTVFVYFANKEELFRAVARSILATHLSLLPAPSAEFAPPLAEFVPALLRKVAATAGSQAPAMVRLLIAEGSRFPDLAQVWHDEVVSKVLTLVTRAIEQGQQRGEVRAGDPLLYAMSIIGPMLAGTLFREVLGNTGARMPDLHELAVQHAGVVLKGMLTETGG